MTLSQILKGIKLPKSLRNSRDIQRDARAFNVQQYNKPIVRLSYNEKGYLSPAKKNIYGYNPQNNIQQVKVVDKKKTKKKQEYKLPMLPVKIKEVSKKICPSGKKLNKITNRCIKDKAKVNSLEKLLKKLSKK